MPAINKKSISFDHLQPKFTTFRDDEENATVRTYQLDALLNHISDSDLLTHTRKQINGDYYIFHVCQYHSDLNIWELQILHLRDKVLPGIADDSGNYELIKLDDHQYPAESTTLLYDPNELILYMQRNRYGISIRNLETYLSELSPENTHVLFAIKTLNRNTNKITPLSQYRKIILTASVEDLEEVDSTSSLWKLLQTVKNAGGSTLNITIGCGRSRRERLNSEKSASIIKDAFNYSGTTKLKVSISKSNSEALDLDDLEFETIDLLNTVCRYNVSIEYSRDNNITHDRLFTACKAAYIEGHQLKST